MLFLPELSGGWHRVLSGPTEGWFMGSQRCSKLFTYLEGGKGHEESTAQLFSTAESVARGLRFSYSCPGDWRKAEEGTQGQACRDMSTNTLVHPAAPSAQLQGSLRALDIFPFCLWLSGG